MARNRQNNAAGPIDDGAPDQIADESGSVIGSIGGDAGPAAPEGEENTPPPIGGAGNVPPADLATNPEDAPVADGDRPTPTGAGTPRLATDEDPVLADERARAEAAAIRARDDAALRENHRTAAIENERAALKSELADLTEKIDGYGDVRAPARAIAVEREVHIQRKKAFELEWEKESTRLEFAQRKAESVRQAKLTEMHPLEVQKHRVENRLRALA